MLGKVHGWPVEWVSLFVADNLVVEEVNDTKL